MLDVLKNILVCLFWTSRRCSRMALDEYKFWQKSIFLLYSAIVLNFALCCCMHGTKDIMLELFCIFATIYIVVVTVIWISKAFFSGDNIDESPYPLNVVNSTFVVLSIVLWLVGVNCSPCNEHENCVKYHVCWRNAADAPILGYVYHDTPDVQSSFKLYAPSK